MRHKFLWSCVNRIMSLLHQTVRPKALLFCWFCWSTNASAVISVLVAELKAKYQVVPSTGGIAVGPRAAAVTEASGGMCEASDADSTAGVMQQVECERQRISTTRTSNVRHYRPEVCADYRPISLHTLIRYVPIMQSYYGCMHPILTSRLSCLLILLFCCYTLCE